jgi:oxepin-CoA hydrolase/3-oxo-5,6-dehydrosuberyl-CoA semialdehyde dehydrogenase
MNEEKRMFLESGFPEFVQKLQPGQKGQWGKMDALQMVEHVTNVFKIAAGEITMPVVTPAEQLPKLRAFLLSDKAFRENTKAPLEVLPEEPVPDHTPSLPIAIEELQKAINHFFEYYKNNPSTMKSHPVFGELNFEEWVLLHYKHLVHHAKQFGLV